MNEWLVRRGTLEPRHVIQSFCLIIFLAQTFTRSFALRIFLLQITNFEMCGIGDIFISLCSEYNVNNRKKSNKYCNKVLDTGEYKSKSEFFSKNKMEIEIFETLALLPDLLLAMHTHNNSNALRVWHWTKSVCFFKYFLGWYYRHR